jgi:carbon starvation protein CstA
VRKLNYKIVLVYGLSLFFLYPVVTHVLMYRMFYLVDKLPHGQFWSFIQICFSGPALIILGLVLYQRYRQIALNKIIGIALVLAGIYWLYVLISDIIKEAA